MAVVEMKKVHFLFHVSDTENVLTEIQNSGAVEIVGSALDVNKNTTDSVSAPNTALFSDVQKSLQFLSGFEENKGLWQTLLEGSTEFTSYDSVSDSLKDISAIQQVVNDVLQLQNEEQSLREQIRVLSEKEATFQRWSSLQLRFSDFVTEQTKTFLLEIGDQKRRIQNNQSLKMILEKNLSTTVEELVLQVIDDFRVVVTIYSSDSDVEVKLLSMTNEIGIDIVSLEGEQARTIAEELQYTTTSLRNLTESYNVLLSKIESFTKENISSLKRTHDALRWQDDRYAALAAAGVTGTVVSVTGWIKLNWITSLQTSFQDKGLAVHVEEMSLQDKEEPPVEIENNRLVKPFEVITRLYGMPGHKDLDPTLFLAGFFFIFFGLSLTDVGYGIFLMIAAALLLFVFKVPKVIKNFAVLLFAMGAASFSVGLLFGGYLGVNVAVLPQFLQSLQQFDPIANPLPVFYLALGLGVVQIMFGMVLKIYSDARNNDLVNGVLDQGPWLLLFLSVIAWLATANDLITVLNEQSAVYMIYATLGLIVVTSGRKGKGIFQKIQYSLLSLYQSIGYFSDILSYSRLLALGLATTALAFAVNLIADIVKDSVPVLGPILAILVLIVGHAFTLAVNTLGAFIHSARLQFVEFFGKFITGTGRSFKPLERKEQYVTVIDK